MTTVRRLHRTGSKRRKSQYLSLSAFPASFPAFVTESSLCIWFRVNYAPAFLSDLCFPASFFLTFCCCSDLFSLLNSVCIRLINPKRCICSVSQHLHLKSSRRYTKNLCTARSRSINVCIFDFIRMTVYPNEEEQETVACEMFT